MTTLSMNAKALSRVKDKNEGDEGPASPPAPAVVVRATTASGERLDAIVAIAKRGHDLLLQRPGSACRDAARLIKRELDANERPEAAAWHVVCGSSFGAYVGYEAEQMAFLAIGAIDMLIFKHA